MKYSNSCCFILTWAFSVEAVMLYRSQKPSRQICDIELYKTDPSFIILTSFVIETHPLNWIKILNKDYQGKQLVSWQMKVFTERWETSATHRGLSPEKQTEHLENPINQLTGWAASQTHGRVPEKGRGLQEIYWARCPRASIQDRENDSLRNELPSSTSAAQLLHWGVWGCKRSIREVLTHEPMCWTRERLEIWWSTNPTLTRFNRCTLPALSLTSQVFQFKQQY